MSRPIQVTAPVTPEKPDVDISISLKILCAMTITRPCSVIAIRILKPFARNVFVEQFCGRGAGKVPPRQREVWQRQLCQEKAIYLKFLLGSLKILAKFGVVT